MKFLQTKTSRVTLVGSFVIMLFVVHLTDLTGYNGIDLSDLTSDPGEYITVVILFCVIPALLASFILPKVYSWINSGA